VKRREEGTGQKKGGKKYENEDDRLTEDHRSGGKEQGEK